MFVTCGLDPHTFRAMRHNARGLRAGGLVAVLGGLRAERGGPTVATVSNDVQATGLPLELLDRAIPGATNDAMLELAIRVQENLGERAETAADVAIDSDDRDAENEALVFIKEVDEIVGAFHAHGTRLDRVDARARDAEHDLKAEIRNRRARAEGRFTALESFSYRRVQRAAMRKRFEVTREEVQGQLTRKRAKVTPDRVLRALEKAVASRGGAVRVADVIVALDTRLVDTSVPGRQLVVSDVSRVLRELAAEDRVTRIRPDDYDGGRRKPHRYAMPEVDDAR